MSKNYKIIRYVDFINENYINLLNLYCIRKFKLNPDTKLIDVFEKVTITHPYIKLKNLPKIRFGKIDNTFNCSHNELTSLEYSPKEVDTFYCNNNKLTSLEYSPEIVNNSYYCYNNDLTSLEYSPKKLNGDFYCNGNLFSSLEYCPSYVGGDFICHDNKNLSYIEDYPRCIIKGKISEIHHFEKIYKIVNENEELFINLLDNKISFHQMVMRLDPSLIKYYRTISPPSKNSKLLL